MMYINKINYTKGFAVYLCSTIFLKLNKGVILSDFLRFTLLFTVVCLKISRNTCLDVNNFKY